MSRYPPSDYRGPRDRSRSPPRYSDRRVSSANIFDGRPTPPSRTASDAPRGPRSQYDGLPRPAPGSAAPANNTSRPVYSSLRDAPPLGSGNDRGRTFRERDYDRRDRPPSPRERSPVRAFKDPRDYPPRELDTVRARRNSRDGPLSAGSTYSDSSHLSFRGGFARGRGRGDFEFRGGRGGRRPDDRDGFRRDRSPPRWGGRDLSRDGRDSDRRDDRRFERREDDRWAPDWNDRERDADRGRRDLPPGRLEPRQSVDSTATTPTHYQPAPASAINPERLAMIEGSGNDSSARRASLNAAPAQAPPRRDVPETPSYLNGRAETTANRYKQRGSSPPAQAPPVPAFTLSFGANAANAANPAPPTQRTSIDSKAGEETPAATQQEQSNAGPDQVTHKEPPVAPKAHFAEAPPTAPKALRAPEPDVHREPVRLQCVRSLETLNGPPSTQAAFSGPGPSATPAQSLQNLPGQATSPNIPQPFVAPTGPRASRMQSSQPSISPRVPFESLRHEQVGFPVPGRGQTPPPSAPSGPRNRSFSVSPKVANTNIPTAPKADRVPLTAPRAPPVAPTRPGERIGTAGPPWGPPTAPRNQQWNQWRRPGVLPFPADKTIPAKRDFAGEDRDASVKRQEHENGTWIKSEQGSRPGTAHRANGDDSMDLDPDNVRQKQNSLSGHSAAQSFFGKPSVESPGDQTLSDVVDEPISSSDDEDLNPEEDAALFNAKFERQKRALEAQIVDLSEREYRATTPLESISRLSRISENDLQRLRESHEMDVDTMAPSAGRRRQKATATSSSGSEDGPDVLTPKGEENNAILIRNNEDPVLAIRRLRERTPEVISLPFLATDSEPFDQSEAFQETLRRQEQTKTTALVAIENDVTVEEENMEDLEADFRNLFRAWRLECEDLDRERERLEVLERQQSLEPGPEPDAPMAPPMSEREGRRLLKFSSEYEIELVLKQSEETARIEQERQDRESKRLQADLEKEALLPDQQTLDEVKRNMFVDMNRRRDAATLTLVFCYVPPPDTFTDEEQRIFIAAFKETPKKWGEIASLLPGRTYTHCIQHYYANKWDNRFRDSRTKRLKAGGGRGRGRGGKSLRGRGAGLMADLGNTDELMPAVSDSGRPKRAAAPTTFGEREQPESKAAAGISPAKKPGPASKNDAPGDEKQPKRRKGLGENKPGRKPKAAPAPLSALAAAPAASPSKPFVDSARAQNLEDASLLTGFQSGQHSVFAAEGYAREPFMPPPPAEEPPRPKTVSASTTRPAASSYWSVPEQTDFVKYIAHFGTDFGAIAAHMGTKTQTMIKNHYQRQIDGGSRPELEEAAKSADRRREAGQDLGAPPTPTPIVKRKYDNPTALPGRSLQDTHKVLQREAEERTASLAQQSAQPGSPAHFPPQPRFASGIPPPSSAAQRVVASPVPAPVTPAVSQSQPVSVTGRPVSHQHQHHQHPQHPLGSRLTFLSDSSRPESRPGTQAPSSFRAAHEGLSSFQSRGQAQPGRPNAADPQYIMGLVAQQEQALRVQQEQSQQERVEQGFQRQHSLNHASNHGSPAVKPMHEPPPPMSRPGPDRPMFKDERAASPPRTFSSTPGLSRPLLGAPMFGSLGSASFKSSVADRGPFSHSPPRREDSRGSMPQDPSQSQPPAPTPAPDPPKRSNLLSILNSEPDEPPPKREPALTATPRTASPAQGNYQHSGPASSLAGISHGSRDMFGQHNMQPSRYGTSSAFGAARETPSSSNFKHESSIGASSSQSTKVDWATSALALNTPQPGQNVPSAMDRDRPFFSGSHRSSAFGALNQPTRANPSPPPHQVIGHSRNSSLNVAARDSRPGGPGQQPPPTAHQNILQANPYSQKPPGPPYGQPPPPQAQNQTHHSHNASIGGTYSPFHHRAPSREEHRRGPEEHAFAPQREREREQDWRRRQDAMEMERARERDREYRAARQREQDQRQQGPGPKYATSHAPPPQPQQASHQPYGTPGFGSSRLGTGPPRDAGGRESEAGFRAAEEEQRRMLDNERWRKEEEYRRRQQEEALYHQQRRTPLGPGGYGVPPPGPSQPRR